MFEPGSKKANWREPKTCLGRVFNYKLGCFEDVHETHVYGCTLGPGFVLLSKVCPWLTLFCQASKLQA